jgi:hypothetical protein
MTGIKSGWNGYNRENKKMKLTDIGLVGFWRIGWDFQWIWIFD